MTDAPCARPGCGAPKAWHTNKSTVEELKERGCDGAKHRTVSVLYTDGRCLGYGCSCDGYLAPEPPQPERTVYVVELTPDQAGSWFTSLSWLTSLADYLASHPQPAPRMCVCGGKPDDHNPVTGRCEHVAKRFNELGWVRSRPCFCPSYLEAKP